MNQPITGVGLRSHSVVIIDQDTEIRSRTARILRTGQYAVHETATIDEARKYLTETTPDAIILDIRWAPAESRAFIEDIKNSSRLRSTPVLVITPPSSEFTAHEVIKMGANDYIEKSQLESILLPKLDTHLHYRQTLLLLERSNQMLAYFAAFDELTGLYNRRAFTEAMRVEVKQMAEAGSCIAVLMIDVDNFKPINLSLIHI